MHVCMYALHMSPDPLMCVLIQKGVSCHVSGLKAKARLDTFQTPQLDKHIVNLGS